MDHKLLRRHSQQHYHREIEPSFSSTLLDAIYRSIDESNGTIDDEMVFCRESSKKKTNKGMMIEKWIEEKNTYENVSFRRKSKADFDRKISNSNRKDSYPHPHPHPVLLNSSSSSSESSCSGGFSSSESDSIKPKPIRTRVLGSSLTRSDQNQKCGEQIRVNCAAPQQYDGDSKYESGFGKTKSKAMKIYGDLKKVKQPISPGGRLATFLNSIFAAGTPKNSKNATKKAKISSCYDERKIKSEQNSTCSSASSFSRSCLSKTPSCRTGNKRSVRFFPVSVIVGEDSRPCGHKNVYDNSNSHPNSNSNSNSHPNSNLKSDSMNEELKFRVMNERQRVEEVARELLKNYQKKKLEEEEEDDDDVASCASSDLFELDNLAAIGINNDQRYREELPVYETTNLGVNRAIIANGLFM